MLYRESDASGKIGYTKNVENIEERWTRLSGTRLRMAHCIPFRSEKEVIKARNTLYSIFDTFRLRMDGCRTEWFSCDIWDYVPRKEKELRDAIKLAAEVIKNGNQVSLEEIFW